VDSNAVQKLRDRYDVNQITPLRYGPPSLVSSVEKQNATHSRR
jgi:hypothetical protein